MKIYRFIDVVAGLFSLKGLCLPYEYSHLSFLGNIYKILTIFLITLKLMHLYSHFILQK